MGGSSESLSEAGFEFKYEEIKREKPVLYVKVGDRPNLFETFAYVTDLSWIPYQHKEAPSVIISANLDGIITSIK